MIGTLQTLLIPFKLWPYTPQTENTGRIPAVVWKFSQDYTQSFSIYNFIKITLNVTVLYVFYYYYYYKRMVAITAVGSHLKLTFLIIEVSELHSQLTILLLTYMFAVFPPPYTRPLLGKLTLVTYFCAHLSFCEWSFGIQFKIFL